MPVSLAEVERRVMGASRLELPSRDNRPAAVLIPLREMEPGVAHSPVEILLTRRAEHLDAHAGQVSFPGGTVDPTDADIFEAALRETHEELGIAPEAVRVLGRLDDMLTITGFHVSPVVGVVEPGVRLEPNPVEVARVFALPLSVAMDEEAWEQRLHPWRGSEVTAWHLPYDGEDVWGATGTMLRDFVALLRGR